MVSRRDACPGDLAAGGCAVAPVARALAWLARHGLMYTDLRPPNVRVALRDGGAVLVDYDDLQLLPRAPASFAAFAELLRGAGVAFALAEALGGPSSGALPAVMVALEALWPGSE